MAPTVTDRSGAGNGSGYRRAEVLRAAGIALQGRVVGLWEAVAPGAVEPVATGPGRPMPESAVREMNESLRHWGVPLDTGKRWLACRLDAGRWCIAPVRLEVPGPPPTGSERRRRERMTLELAALVLGLLDRMEAARRLQETAEAELTDFLENAAIAMHSVDAGGTILRANRAELELMGYAADEYEGRNIADFHADAELAADLLRRLAAGEALHNVEARLRAKDGAIRHVLISSNIQRDEAGVAHARCFTRDVTELKLAEMQLRHGMLHDRLTSLPNRALFLEHVRQSLLRVQRDEDYRFAVIFVDCDHFKVINDSLGHLAGDQLLTAIALRLEAITRPGDVVARFGGDEFTLCVEDVGDVLDAARVADRIRAELREPFPVEGQEVFVTASVGIALGGPQYTGAEDLLRDADIAMYRAKGQGRSRYELFDPAMRDRAKARLRLETDLRRAVERHELRLAWQPIVELESGRIEGLEALLRWAQPERGELEPLEFIPVAEESELIVPIGAWVLREACRQARQWQRTVPGAQPLKVSVNLSARQLAHPGLLDAVATALRESDLPAACLRLEITESVLVDGMDEAAAQLERLAGLGVALQMDDFGTGYSSLGYLRRFPLSALKIDRSFVRRMGARRGDYEVVRTVVALAQNLGLGVIAEGVETAVQRDRLLALGCGLGQGFLFSRAVETAAVEAMLRRGQLDPHELRSGPER